MNRPISILLAFALSALSAFGQYRFTGSGLAMRPTFDQNAALVVWPSVTTELRVGDIVARRLDSYLIGTRVIAISPDGIVTRSDRSIQDDPGYLTDETLIGKVYPDLRRRTGRTVGPLAQVTGLYVLTPYVERPFANTIRSNGAPPPIGPPTDSIHPVPDSADWAAYPILLILSVLGMRRMAAHRTI